MTIQRRSDRTRATILAAARERFAAEGYERATIRGIAGDAGIDPSMVMRYYGNKEGLFAAAMDFDLRFPDLTGLPREDIGRRMTEHFVGLWDAGQNLQLLLRAGATNELAVGRLQHIFAEQLAPAIASLHPPTAPPAEIAARAGMAAAQVLGLALCRYMLRLPPVADMAPADIVDWVGPTLQRYLAGPAPEQRATG